MTSTAIILAIPGLALLVLLWTIWRCVVRRPRPSSAPLERSGGVAVIFLLMAAGSALNFSDRVAFISSTRGGPLAPFEWIAAGGMLIYLFIAGAFSGTAFLLWFQRRRAKQQSAGSQASGAVGSQGDRYN
jgi:hypothetical protein